MPLPVIAASILPVVGKWGLSITAGWGMVRSLDALYGPTFDISKLASTYQANFKNPIVIPNVEELIRSLYTGKVSPQILAGWLKYHGIGWEPNKPFDQMTDESKWWNHVILNNRPQLPIEQYLRFARQGRLGDQILAREKIEGKLLKLGIFRDDDRELFFTQYDDLPIDIIQWLWRNQQINEEEYIEYLNRVGIRKPRDQEILKTLVYQKPNTDTVLEIANRSNLNDAQTEDLLRSAGWNNSGYEQQISNLRKHIPPYTDIVTMGVKEAWDQNIVNTYLYDDERPAEFDYWMEKQGYNWGEAVGNNPMATWPQLIWRAHWRTISPEQAFAMLHRFRPKPDNPAMSVVDGVPAWTMDNVRDMLKIHDYPKPLRDLLANLSYRVSRLIDINRGIRYINKDRDWAIGKFQDRGHRLADAQDLADIAIAINDEYKNRRNKKWRERNDEKRISNILDRFNLGIYDYNQTFTLLEDPVKDNQIRILMIANAGNELEQKNWKYIVSRIKHDFTTGCINEVVARARLNAIGIIPDRINNYIILWKMTMTCHHKTLTTREILDSVRDGLMTIPDATQRLINLGWSNADRLILSAKLAQEIAVVQNKVIAANQKTAAQQAKAMEKAIKDHKNLIRQIQSDLRRMYPISILKKLAKKNRISQVDFTNRLETMGYSHESIGIHWADCCENGNGELSDENRKESKEIE